MSRVKEILDDLKAASLRNLCRHLALRVSGSKEQLQQQLSRYFGDNAEELLEMLKRKELIELLSSLTFELEGREGELIRLADANKDALLDTAREIYVHDWIPDTEDESPGPPDSAIRIEWYGERAADTFEEESEADELDDEQKLWDWLDGRLEGRDHIGPRIKTLVNKLGRHRAQQRLRTKAVQELGHVLARGGFFTDPDLSAIEQSPGIDARVRIWRSKSRWKQPDTGSFRPVPPPVPRPVTERRPEIPTPTAEVSDYQRACLELHFVVPVAASLCRLDKQDHRHAVELVTRQANVSAADTIRLQAMAHKYASGHVDVQPAIKELRVLLDITGRKRLLDHICALAPQTSMRDQMLKAYAEELGIPATAIAPAPSPTALVSASPAAPVITSPAHPTTTGQPVQAADPPPAQAGGIRANQLLDSIFRTDKGEDL